MQKIIWIKPINFGEPCFYCGGWPAECDICCMKKAGTNANPISGV